MTKDSIYVVPQIEVVEMDIAVNLMNSSFNNGKGSVDVDDEGSYTGPDALSRGHRGSWGNLWTEGE